MNVKRYANRLRVALALGAVSVLVAVGSAGAAGASGTIKSGAGPGWPSTLSPSDFVAHVDNPYFPLKPGSQYRYRAARTGSRSSTSSG